MSPVTIMERDCIPNGHPTGALWLAALHATWLAAALSLLFVVTPGSVATAQEPTRPSVVLIDLKGAIGFVSVEHLAQGLKRAATLGSPALIVRLDTPGGLLASTRDVIQSILASPVPVVMYVAPGGSRAASAGTYMMFSSHIAAMAPGTHLGAATPIALSSPGAPPPPQSTSDRQPEKDGSTTEERKSINDAVAYMRALAELRGRNAEWGEKAVREAATLTATAALDARVIDLIANDVTDLLTKIDGRTVKLAAGDVRLNTKGVSVTELVPDWKMRVMATIADPNIALILLMIGIYGILFEFWSPGAIAPGVVGGICLIVALTALSVLPVNYAGLALLLFGIALMVSETFMPSFGIVGLGGIVAFALGALFLFDPAQSDVSIAVSWRVIAGLSLLSAAILAGVLGLAVRARSAPVRIGEQQMIGRTGRIISWKDQSGYVAIDGETWEAQSKEAFGPGQSVRVVGRTGLILAVESVS